MENAVAQKSKGIQRSHLQTNGTLCLWILGVLLLASAIALRIGVMNTNVRAVVAATLIFGVYTGLIHIARLCESNPKTLYPVMFFIGLAVLWGTLGSKVPNADGIRRGYVKELNSFIGDRYALGGEVHTGVDCSGLARSAMWQAMLKEGVREFNPYLLGPRLWSFWWRDLSASDMLNERYGYTVKLDTAKNLADYDHTYLRAGDMAVVSGTYHVLIYLGDNKWIEANPDDKKVVVNVARPGSKRPYFNTQVTLMRWWILQQDA